MSDLEFQMLDDEQQYQAGITACKSGDSCPVNASKAFEAGYGEQYAKEQCEEYYVNSKR